MGTAQNDLFEDALASEQQRAATQLPLHEAIEVHPDDTVTIYGVRYSGDLFRGLGFATPPGVWLRITKRETDGVVTLVVFEQQLKDGDGPPP